MTEAALELETDGSEPPGGTWTRLDRRLLLLVLVPYAALVARFSFLIDDAFISFRYAKNWAEGNGLRFNLGPEAPVEGFSNFLWVSLLALCELLSIPQEVGSRVLSVASGVALVVLFHRLLRVRFGLASLAAFAGTGFLVTFPPVVVWSTSGLETMAYALSLFGVYLLLCADGAGARRRTVLAALCGIAAATLRVEGVAWAVLIPLLAGFSLWKRGTPARALLARFALYLAVLGAVCGALLVARKAYFGDWVANTVHAKAVMSPDSIGRGLKTTATFYLTVFTGILATVLAVPAALRPRETHRFVGGMLVLGFAAYHVLVGGDWMPMFRFLVPAAPYMALLVALWVASLRVARPVVAGVWVLLVALNVAPAVGRFDEEEGKVYTQILLTPRALREACYFRHFKAGYQTELERWYQTVSNTEKYRIQGRALRLIAGPKDAFVTGPIGAMGFYSGVYIYDRNGLVNREVAMLPPDPEAARSAGHDKRVSRAYFLDKKPRFLRLGFAEAIPKGPMAPRFVEPMVTLLRAAILDDPEDLALHEHSTAHLYPLAGQPGLPPEVTLVTLEYCDDPETAKAFWARLGYEPR